MVIADAVSYIDYLESLGFARPTPEGSPEVVLIVAVGSVLRKEFRGFRLVLLEVK
jgi:hypothetical protein